MSALRETQKERLRRLMDLGRCTAKNASEYEHELQNFASQVVTQRNLAAEMRLFKALADMTRLRILAMLTTREMCACEIMTALGLSQPNTSHHLRILETAGIIRQRKEGKWTFYSISQPSALSVVSEVQKLVRA